MKAYGYVRISRDEDNKKESIETQRKVVEDFAKEQGFILNDTFQDNNVSGYTFERPSLLQLKELIEDNKVDILVAKDLSRIGRHNAKTLLFLDYLDEHNVRLMLKNDNYDSDSDDDSIIGIKTWYNEMYLKDLSKKIKTNIKQKQKEGLVIVPNYGYMKDPNNPKKIIVDEDVVDTIKLIFRLYIEGMGCTKIAHYLNEKHVETPSIHKMKKFGFGWKPDWTQKELWYATSIKRILHNDAYIGVLRCGVTKLSKMKGKKVRIPKEEQIVHENYFEPIISKDDFELVKMLAESRCNNNIRAKNEKIHRYAGILKCGDCNKGFVARKNKTQNYEHKITYVCATFHRYGSELCNGHRLFESDIDELVLDEIKSLLHNAKINLDNIDKNIEEKRNHRKDYDKAIEVLKIKIVEQKEEIKNYAKQLAKGLIGEEIFEELTSEAKVELDKLEKLLVEAENSRDNHANDKEKIIKCIEVLQKILDKNELTNADVTMLIEKIVVTETDEVGKYNMSKLDIEINWNTQFVL
ncbi:site-specific DNA recombinase [Clostridium pasteurianum DSM 525 = ATCC 6013]|uniref:Resolvase domain-containing protein n=1 Tax=Clostridium pasteurianum DSM 525 = ATCC 6013 TaxID=1262449 RepID=A0A0H3J904_CLOPA|nr:recombinase family protein [Clostridium pasteurianum]AJA48478.1 site-specific DNA recombinase [Clostridium pasteurianum DSM 525 = ATCC 6013]AJA52466.1 site-specific DNA recombinase [Clostridium pasteurianum DSM 525 = ATCC 6013]AOZ75719.1 hypothetical protein AQ983_11705 [Clostridium pasteurianum DSM 525 = ATCC 6013]AOZ79515.1 hypothetical protein AQ984_11700 [Clostridium pasteurianum]ELP60374.1 Site-specific DNA recombinase [Clostridium pasteurianum DSM 525 = ATCC 6013]